MQWILDLGGNFIPGAKAAQGAAVGLYGSLQAANGAMAGLGSSTVVGAGAMRQMHTDLAAAEAELGQLERAAKRMQGGPAVDLDQWRGLQAEIAKSRNKVQDLNGAIIKGGGANFDTKAHDAKIKASEKWFSTTVKGSEKAEKEAAKTAAKQAAEATKAKAKEAKQQATDAKAADSENAKTAAALWSGAKYVAATAVAAGAAIVGVGIAGFYTVASKALQTQYGAQARLNAIQMRFNIGLREISRNANLTPFLVALDRGAAMFDKNTATGKFMGEQVKRAFDGVGKVVTALTPYAERAFAKMLVGSVRVETGFLRVVAAGAKIAAGVLGWAGATEGRLDAIRIAAGATSAALGAIGSVISFVSGALGGGVGWGLAAAGIALLGLKAGSAALSVGKLGLSFVQANPGIAAATVAIVALVAAWQQLQELRNQWDDNSWEQIKNQFSGDENAMSKRQGIVTGEDYDRKHGLGKFANKGAGEAAGKPVGEDIGKGIVVGLKSTEGAVEAAGGDLTKAAITGAKKEGEIKSPSGKARREVGRNLGAGTRLGMLDEAKAVEDTARKALFPDVFDGGGAGGGSGRAGKKMIYVDLRNSVFNGTQTEADIQRMVDASLVRALDQAEEADDAA